MSKIWTNQGKLVDVRALTVDDIDPWTICHSLSLVNRYTGHTKRPYSVMEHSVQLALHSPKHLRLAALVHDWTEAFLNDMPGPLKKHIPDYVEYEREAQAVIQQATGIPAEDFEMVHDLDLRIRTDEFEQLFSYPYSTNVPGLGVKFAERPWEQWKQIGFQLYTDWSKEHDQYTSKDSN